MRLGPVFQAELFTLSRRARFFVGRTLYGLLVLFIVSSTYKSMAARYGMLAEIPINALAEFGQAIFVAFATLQGAIVLTLTPALVAGAIADEKQRKTLHYLMASQLSSAEVILGKIGARLIRVAIIGAIGLPVLSLISLFGGVDPLLVLMVYGATATTTFLLASVSMSCSIHAVKPRDAIMRAYLIEILWLTIPTFMLSTMPFWSPFYQAIGEFTRPVLEWVALSSPTDLLRHLGTLRGNFSGMIGFVLWMMGIQILYGSLFILYATLRLRPVFQGEGRPSWWRRWFGPRREARPQWRLWARPACYDDAVLWKEMYLHRVSPLKRVTLLLLGLGAVGLTGYAAWDTMLGACNERIHGSGWSGYGPNQRDINSIVRSVNATLIVVILIGLGSVAASSISSEREGDTWTNLTSSPIDGPELIRGKILGAIWTFRSLIFVLAGCWAFGLLIGSLHPLGVFACAVELSVFTWFVAALGVAVSLQSKNTIQALTQTIGLLILLNGGYLIIFLMVPVNTTLILAGCIPFHFTASMLGMDELQANREAIATIIAGTICYAFGAAFLTFHSIQKYDAVVDRPDRNRNALTPESLRRIQAASRTMVSNDT